MSEVEDLTMEILLLRSEIVKLRIAITEPDIHLEEDIPLQDYMDDTEENNTDTEDIEDGFDETQAVMGVCGYNKEWL